MSSGRNAQLVLLAALVAGSLAGLCPDKPAVSPFDATKLQGAWDHGYWPTIYVGNLTCGNQTFDVIGHRINFKVMQYDVPDRRWIISTGHIHQHGDSGKFQGQRDGVADNVAWQVTGFSENKWLSYWQCREDNGYQLSFLAYKKGVTLTREEEAEAVATLVEPADFYVPIDYTQCPE